MGSPEDLARNAIAAIDASFGVHPGHRVVHAKGVLCRGTFVASEEASRLTRAAHMQGEPIGVTVRFSNASGNPDAPDRIPDGRGMAVAFYLPDGGGTDIVAVTLPSFVARTPEDFVAFTRAAKPFIGDLPGPRLLSYALTHRSALPAIAAGARFKPPVSYATLRYNALHAFRWIAADGSERYVRYSWIPAAGEESLKRSAAKGLPADYLQEEVAARLEREPIRFTLEVQIAEPGDPTDDATVAWPADRERVVVGSLELTELDTVRERDGDILVFDPTRVTDGIELSDDPLVRMRSHAYSISVERRTGAPRPQEIS